MYRSHAIKTALAASLLTVWLGLVGRVALAAESTNPPPNLNDEFRAQAREEILRDKLRSKVLVPFQRQDSLEGMLPMPYQPQPQISPAEIRKLRQRLEERRNWAMEDPADSGNRTADKDKNANPMISPESEGDMLSMIRKHYESFNTKTGVTNNRASLRDPRDDDRDDWKNSDKNDRTRRLERSPERLAPENPLKALLDPQEAGQLKVGIPSSMFSDVFTPSSVVPIERSRADTQRDSEFKRMLEGNAPTAPDGFRARTALGGLGLPAPGESPAASPSLMPVPKASALPGFAGGDASGFGPRPAGLPELEQPRMFQQNRPTGPPKRIF